MSTVGSWFESTERLIESDLIPSDEHKVRTKVRQKDCGLAADSRRGARNEDPPICE
jgi:hypothetical protein